MRRRTGPPPMPTPSVWVQPIADWTLALNAAGRSPETVATRTDHMRRAARVLATSPWDVTGDDLVRWVGDQEWSREYRRSVYASLRGFYGWALGSGRCDQSPAAVLPSVKPGPVLARPAPEHVYKAALRAAGEREALMLRLAGEVGLRRAEIAQIHAMDLVEDLDGWSLVVHGKGDKDREVTMPPGLALTIRLRAGDGWAFPGDDHGHLSPRRVGILAARALSGEWTLHTLRHRFASIAYQEDHDLITLQQTLGHASVATTQRYVRVMKSAMRRMVMAVAAA